MALYKADHTPSVLRRYTPKQQRKRFENRLANDPDFAAQIKAVYGYAYERRHGRVYEAYDMSKDTTLID